MGYGGGVGYGEGSGGVMLATWVGLGVMRRVPSYCNV